MPKIDESNPESLILSGILWPSVELRFSGYEPIAWDNPALAVHLWQCASCQYIFETESGVLFHIWHDHEAEALADEVAT